MRTPGPFRTSILVVAPALLVAVGAQRAAGSGFLVARFGGEHGHPATSHPSAIYYNPAGLSLAHGTRVYLEGLLAYRSLSYDRPCGAIDNPPVGCGEAADADQQREIDANTGKNQLGDLIASPFFAAVSDLGVPNLGVGIGLSAPFGGSSSWDKNDAFAGDERFPGAVDGSQRWSVIEGTIRIVYFTAAGAYRIPSAHLSFGVGLNVVRGSIDTIRARTISGSDDLLQNGQVFEGRSLLEVSGTTFSLGAGVIWQPVPEAAIGLSYQSQPGFGNWAMSGKLTNKFGAGAVTETDVDLEQSLPDVVRLGGTYMMNPKLELRLFGEMVRWSTLDKQCLTDRSNPDRDCSLNADGSLDTAAGGASVVQNVQRDWNNAFGIRGGASYWLNPTVELIGGVGFDGNAVPDETVDPSLIDMNKLTLAVGGTFGLLDERLHLTGTYTHVFYFKRTVEPREAPLASPSVNPDGAGDYKQWVGVFLLGVEYGF